MIFVTDISSKKVAPGQMISVFGGFFDPKVGISFGDKSAAIIECEDDFVSAVVPEMSGDVDVKVFYNGSLIKIFTGVSVVSLAETQNRNPAKEYTDDDFDQYIRSLFPRGIAFSMGNDSNLSKLISSVASAFYYVWSVIRSLMVAVDPSHTSNFDEWESELSLPEVGISPVTFDGRRSEIYRMECTEGGCTINYIHKILSLMNVESDVYEYTKNPEKFSDVDFGDYDVPQFFYKILFHLQEKDFTKFSAGESSAGDAIQDFTQYREESVFNKVKQSHTKIIFGYDDGIRYGFLLDENGCKILTSENECITYKTHLW